MIVLLAAALAAPQPPSCACPRSIGAEAGSPPLVVASAPADLPGLVACGYLDSRTNEAVRASEFEVFSCGSDSPVVTFGALQSAVLRASGHDLLITEVARWPFGPNGEWVDVALWEYVVTPASPPSVSKRFVLTPPVISREEVAKVLQQYAKAAAAPGPVDDFDGLTGRLLAAALSGDDEARATLLGLGDGLHPDGAFAYVWTEALDTYHLYVSHASDAGRGGAEANPALQPSGDAPGAER